MRKSAWPCWACLCMHYTDWITDIHENLAIIACVGRSRFSLDIEVQSLLSLPAPSAAGGVSVSAPGAVSEGRPHGRPRRGKRGPRGKACMTREQREQELLKDQRISAVEARQVLCRMCGRWIKLCRQSDFVMQNWNTHAVRCQEKTGCVCYFSPYYQRLTIFPLVRPTL